MRPTSETLFCDFYAQDVHSYRDLPKELQPVVFRSEMGEDDKTVPPLQRVLMAGGPHRSCDRRGSIGENRVQMLNLYADFCEEFLAIPVVRGQKTDKEKFAGAEATYTIESLMHDGKALQSGTSHNFGDGFAKAFGIQYAA